jgi:hypothetical protein
MAPTSHPHDQDPGGPDDRRPPFPAPNPHDDLGAYAGLPQQQAEQRAYDRGWQTVRSLPPDAVVTMEYVVGRLNFTVAEGRVQRCWMG